MRNMFKKISAIILAATFFAGLNADTVTVTYDNTQQVLISAEDIPCALPEVNVPTVEVPTVNVPVVEIPKTNAETLQDGLVESVPVTTYTEAATVKIDDYKPVEIETTTPLVITLEDYSKLGYTVTDCSIVGTANVPYIDADRYRLIVDTINNPKSASTPYTPYVWTLPELGGNAATVTISNPNTATTSLYNPSVPYINLFDFSLGLPDTNIPLYEVPSANVAVPNIDLHQKQVELLMYLMTEFGAVVKDKRSLTNEFTSNLDVEGAQKWLDIYKNYSTETEYKQTYVPMHKGLRMIAEARVPKTAEEATIQLTNLKWYKAQGFNACLLAVYMDEEFGELLNTANQILNQGYDLYIVYSGPDSLKTPVFVNPDKIARYIGTLAPKSRGMLLGWRRTSVHLFMQDRAFSNFIIKTAREANPAIELLGEGYYGPTAQKDVMHNVTYNMPKNMSACVIVGVGYRNANISGVLNGLFRTIVNDKKVMVISGNYSDTTLPFGTAYRIKRETETKFRAAGVTNIIMLHGDGRNDSHDKLTTPRQTKL